MGPFSLRFEPRATPHVTSAPWTTLHDYADGAPFVAVAREGDAYRVRVHTVGDFVVRRGETEVRAEVSSPFDDEAVQQAFSDFVLPAAYQLLGLLAFHASAVALGERVLGFLGTSGRGKSTLAASLAPSGRVFADDCLAIERHEEGWTAQPEGVLPQLRSASAQHLIPGGASSAPKTPFVTPLSSRATRLGALYVLEEGQGCELSPIRRSEALMLLASHLYRVDWASRELLGNELDQLDRLVRDVPVRRLAYARSFDIVPELVRCLTQDAKTWGH